MGRANVGDVSPSGSCQEHGKDPEARVAPRQCSSKRLTDQV